MLPFFRSGRPHQSTEFTNLKDKSYPSPSNFFKNGIYHYFSGWLFFKILQHHPFKMTHLIFKLAGLVGQFWQMERALSYCGQSLNSILILLFFARSLTGFTIHGTDKKNNEAHWCSRYRLDSHNKVHSLHFIETTLNPSSLKWIAVFKNLRKLASWPGKKKIWREPELLIPQFIIDSLILKVTCIWNTELIILLNMNASPPNRSTLWLAMVRPRQRHQWLGRKW